MSSLTRAELLSFLRHHRYAVQSSVSPQGTPQAAVVGVAITDRFEVVFDTLETSRKAQNLRANPAVALTFGSLATDAARTVQMEGRAVQATGPDRERLITAYLEVFPDGVERQDWTGLVYFCVTPSWLRYSDFSVMPPVVEEWDLGTNPT